MGPSDGDNTPALPEDRHDPELATAPAVLARFKRALNISMAAVIALALVYFLGGEAPAALTVQPQKLAGLVGIATAPLLHGSVEHLAANALSVLILGTLAGTVFPRATLRALPLIWFGAGFGTWLIGTGGYHLGASGVTHGLGYLVFTLAVLRRDRASIAAALIAFFFFGGIGLRGLGLDLPAVATPRRERVGAPPEQAREHARDGAGQVRFPGDAHFHRQHAQEHAAEEEEGDQRGGDRCAVAAQHGQGEHQVPQAMGDEIGRAHV